MTYENSKPLKVLFLSSGASHGTFQAGALVALDDLGWKPDVVIGTSVGAINGAGYASGMTGERLVELWMQANNKDIYRLRPWKEWLNFWKWNHLADTKPLRELIQKHINLDRLKQSEILTLISGIDVQSGCQRLFTSKNSPLIKKLESFYPLDKITHESILSSASIPGIFPAVNGVWDGAYLQNNPLKPAVLLEADELVVIHTHTGNETRGHLQGLVDTAWRIIEHTTTSLLLRDIELLKQRNNMEGYRNIPITVINPTEELGFSKLNFSDIRNKNLAVNNGYKRTIELMEVK